MPLSPNFQFAAPTKEQMNLPDYAGSLARGLEAGFMPAVKSTDLLNKMMQAKYNQFKAGPEYQQAMLDFLRGQGAHQWGQAALAPTQGAVNTAHAEALRQQALASQQKNNLLQEYFRGAQAKNVSNQAQRDINQQNQPDYDESFMNVLYNNPEQEGGYQFVGQEYPQNEDSAQGLRDYSIEKALSAALGIKPPSTFIDPMSGIEYAKLRDGRIVNTGQNVSEASKTKAAEYGKNEAKADKELTSQRDQVSRTLSDINRMKSILKDPASKYAFSSFGKGKYAIEMNPFVSEKIKDIRGQLLPITKDFLANAISPLRGLGAMSNKEFEQFTAAAPSVDEHHSIAEGKLKTLESLTNQLDKRLKYTEKLKKEGYDTQEAQKLAAKKFEIKTPHEFHPDNRTITIKNNKTGVTETVTITEARKRGVPNV